MNNYRSRQFESDLLRQFAQILGIEKWRMSPYNPKANGLIKKFLRPLKAVIMVHKTIKLFPIILFGL